MSHWMLHGLGSIPILLCTINLICAIHVVAVVIVTIAVSLQKRIPAQ